MTELAKLTRSYQPTPAARVIVDAIAEQGRQRQWLAARLGYSPAMLSFWLTGYRPMPIEMAFRAAEILGIPRSVIETASAQ
ncbi:MAG: helix-turn-helix transcriptional regulator [Dehalococcoidia bacterium]